MRKATFISLTFEKNISIFVIWCPYKASDLLFFKIGTVLDYFVLLSQLEITHRAQASIRGCVCEKSEASESRNDLSILLALKSQKPIYIQDVGMFIHENDKHKADIISIITSDRICFLSAK